MLISHSASKERDRILDFYGTKNIWDKSCISLLTLYFPYLFAPITFEEDFLCIYWQYILKWWSTAPYLAQSGKKL